MPQKFNVIKPKQTNYNTSKILKPKQIKKITTPKYKLNYPNLRKNKTVNIIKPKKNYDTITKVQQPKKKQPTYNIIKPKTSPLIRVKPKQTTTKILKPKQIRVLKRKRVYHGRVDESLPTLKKMLKMGYDMITFEARNTACPICKGLNGYTFDLKFWLGQLKHEAPIFEISHVQCLDYLRVWDSEDMLPDMWVNWTGNFIFNQP